MHGHTHTSTYIHTRTSIHTEIHACTDMCLYTSLMVYSHALDANVASSVGRAPAASSTRKGHLVKATIFKTSYDFSTNSMQRTSQSNACGCSLRPLLVAGFGSVNCEVFSRLRQQPQRNKAACCATCFFFDSHDHEHGFHNPGNSKRSRSSQHLGCVVGRSR